MPYDVHAVYNDLKHGLFQYGRPTEHLAIDLSIGSRNTQSTMKDCFKIQTGLGFDEKLLIRCLTLIPDLTKIVNNLGPIRSYFLKEFPKLGNEEKNRNGP